MGCVCDLVDSKYILSTHRSLMCAFEHTHTLLRRLGQEVDIREMLNNHY